MTSVSVDEVSTLINPKVVFKHLVFHQLNHFWVLHDCVAACHSAMINVVRVIPIPLGKGGNFSDYNLNAMSCMSSSGCMVLSRIGYWSVLEKWPICIGECYIFLGWW